MHHALLPPRVPDLTYPGAELSRCPTRRAPTSSRTFASRRIGQGVSKRIAASTKVKIPSVHAMNGGGVMLRRSSHSTIRPITTSGGPKLAKESQYALLAGLMLAKSAPPKSPPNPPPAGGGG